MQSVAERWDEGAVVQEIGRVDAVGEHLWVTTSRGRYRAELAVSCLVEPCEGDTVMLGATETGQVFVLAVLRRPTAEPPRLRVEGDLKVSAGGRISFVAAEGVDIATEKRLNIVSGRLDVRSREGQLIVDSLGYVGKLVRLDVDKVKSVVSLFDQVVDRLTLKAKRSYRFVDEVDVTRAEQVDIRATENVAVRGRNAVVNAEQLVKVDGRQIHLG